MQNYGIGDASFHAAGGESGIKQLVDDFYYHMSHHDRGHHIFEMHQGDLTTIKDKLTVFLIGWLGGPRNYTEKYGQIAIPLAHQHLIITHKERDDWLFCMKKALEDQNYKTDFNSYLLKQLAIPAQRIVQVAQKES